MHRKRISAKSFSHLAKDLAWPLISLLSVGLSLWMLQVKLEAEVSTDPVIRAALAEGAFWSHMKVVSNAIFERLAEIPFKSYFLPVLATMVAYAALAWYDRISLSYLGRLTGISWRYIAASSFVAYALGHNIGASVVSGGAVRLRAYLAKGLTKAEVAVLITMTSFTFVFGTILLLGLLLLFLPQIVAPVSELIPLLRMPEGLVRAIGAAMLALCFTYVVGSLLRLKPLCIGKLRLVYPSSRIVGRQLLAAPLELMAAAAIVYFALPQEGNPGFLIVLGAFLLSFSAGLLSQVPGGIGVMEAVFLVLLPGVPSTSVMAALLVWRLLYLLVPLALSGPIVLSFEYVQLRAKMKS